MLDGRRESEQKGPNVKNADRVTKHSCGRKSSGFSDTPMCLKRRQITRGDSDASLGSSERRRDEGESYERKPSGFSDTPMCPKRGRKLREKTENIATSRESALVGIIEETSKSYFYWSNLEWRYQTCTILRDAKEKET